MEDTEVSFEEEYEKLREGKDLPEFKSLAEDFDIEKLAEKESSFIAREIRRAINEKLSAYLQLFETLTNPTAPPMFVFSILRGLSEEDKERIKKLYKRLSKIQVKMMKLDAVYSEKEEIKFIKDSFEEWQGMKEEILSLITSFEENFEKDNGSRKKAYFG